VSDDGGGISESQLRLAVSRHCTSKLSDDLLDIRTLGFRGEALPSIGSVSRLTVRSRAVGASGSYEVRLEGGHMSAVQPAALSKGTIVEVRDLFFNIPARLKFMKGERAESSAITDVVKRIAIAFPQVRFELSGSDRQALTLAACAEGGEGLRRRIANVMGEEFPDNALEVDASREAVRLTGLAGIPSFSRANSLSQFAYVNGRPVRDKLIAGSIRAAYADVMARDRHAVTALFIDLEPGLVDVNVHPAKADVRFRDPGLVRGLIIGAIREKLAASGIRPATTGAAAMMGSFSRGFDPGRGLRVRRGRAVIMPRRRRITAKNNRRSGRSALARKAKRLLNMWRSRARIIVPLKSLLPRPSRLARLGRRWLRPILSPRRATAWC
jgi:DNA mismatch repair protein MutL